MSSTALVVLGLLFVMTIAGFAIWLLDPCKQSGFRRDDGAGLVHTGAYPGHTSPHDCSPSADAGSHCGGAGS